MPQATSAAVDSVERVLSAVLAAVRRETGAGEISPDAAHAVGEAIRSLAATQGQVPDSSASGGDPVQAVIDRAVAFIDAYLDDPALSVAAIAADSCISPRHLQRAFAARGTTVTAVIRQRRLERAKAHLIRRRDVPISHIAHHWGFADLAHFSRLFKAAYGEAPSAYRRRHAF
jgi:AraC-like DNA-binding protein